MKKRERFLYIFTILLLGTLLIYSQLYLEDDYFDIYQEKLNALNSKIDSLHNVNDGLSLQIDSLNSEITALDVEIDKQDEEIDRIREEANEKTAAIDTLTTSQLSKFFTDRYSDHHGQFGSDTTGADSTSGN